MVGLLKEKGAPMPTQYDVLFMFVFFGAIASWMLYHIFGIFRALRAPFYSGDFSQRQSRKIDGKLYVFLQNIVRKRRSTITPRPEDVISRYENDGWKIKICEDAQDVYGNPVAHCRSLWGLKIN